MFRFFFCLLLAASFSSCDRSPDEESQSSIACNSYPSGTPIWINNDSTGFATPHIFHDLAPGNYRIEFKLPHYTTARFEFYLYSGRDLALNASLEMRAGDLALVSNPPGATATIVGVENAFSTPDTAHDLYEGYYTAIFSLENYFSDTLNRIWVGTGDIRTAHAYLIGLPGSLTVTTDPPGASLRFAGYTVDSVVTPCTFSVSATGSPHHLVAFLEGYQPVDTIVSVPPNGTQSIFLPLSP